MSNGQRPALADEATSRAFEGYRRRAVLTFLVGLAACGLVVAAVSLTPLRLPGADASGFADRVSVYVVIWVVFMAVTGVLSWRRAARMQALLAAYPWVQRRYRISVDPSGNRRPALLLCADGDHPEAILLVSALRWRVRPLADHNGGDILTAGTATKRVVLRLPGSEALFVARRPRTAWWRRRLRAAAVDG